MNELERCRKQIDAIDEQLLKLLNERAQWAVRAGHWKKTNHEPVWQPDRELQILHHVEQSNPGPLDNAAIRRLFERIIDEARSLERHIVSESDPQPQRDEGPAEQEKE
jgi:chorismate mutase